MGERFRPNVRLLARGVVTAFGMTLLATAGFLMVFAIVVLGGGYARKRLRSRSGSTRR